MTASRPSSALLLNNASLSVLLVPEKSGAGGGGAGAEFGEGWRVQMALLMEAGVSLLILLDEANREPAFINQSLNRI